MVKLNPLWEFGSHALPTPTDEYEEKSGELGGFFGWRQKQGQDIVVVYHGGKEPTKDLQV